MPDGNRRVGCERARGETERVGRVVKGGYFPDMIRAKNGPRKGRSAANEREERSF